MTDNVEHSTPQPLTIDNGALHPPATAWPPPVPAGQESTDQFVTPAASCPVLGDAASTARPRRRRLRVIALAFVVTACVVTLGVTALVQASQRRDADATVQSTRRDLATAQDELTATGSDLTAARAATDAAQKASASEQARADEAERNLDEAKAVILPVVTADIASTLGVSQDTATCIANAVIDRVGLAETLQAGMARTASDAPPDLVQALLLAEADCIAPAPTA